MKSVYFPKKHYYDYELIIFLAFFFFHACLVYKSLFCLTLCENCGGLFPALPLFESRLYNAVGITRLLCFISITSLGRCQFEEKKREN